MHQPPQLYHRDIRWPNVIRHSGDSSDWFLIDWEDASLQPTQAALYLDRENHAPAVFSNDHGSEVDMWSVGQLIIESTMEIRGISRELQHIGESMKDGTIVTANDALDAIKLLISSHDK